MGASAGSRQRSQARNEDRPQDRQGATPLAEWIAAAVGLVVVLVTLGCLAWLARSEHGGSVDPVSQVVSIERQGDRHLVTLKVENAGSAPAAALRLQAQLRQGERVVEEAEVEFDYLPARSNRTAGVFFQRDPRQFTLELSPRSYRQP